jgi:hypothetical protein
MYRTVPASRLARLVAAAFFLSLPSAALGQVVDVLHSFRGCLLADGSLGDCSPGSPDEWARRSESDPFAARKVIHLGGPK